MGSNNKVVSITRSLSESQKCDLLKLWNSEFPTQIGFEDMEALEAYLHKLGNKKHYLIDDQDVMVAWLCVFERNDEVWFIIIISLDHQGKRLGSRLMKAAQEDNKALQPARDSTH